MDVRSAGQWIVAVVVIMAGACGGVVFAGPVRIYTSDFDLPIPAEPGNTRGWMADAVIEIPRHFVVCDLDVTLTLAHTNVFDLQIFLQSPAGKRLCLNMYNPYKEFFEGEDYIETTFDDEAPIPVEHGKPPFTGRFRPVKPYKLSRFDGEDAYGLWQLQIYDAFYWDVGNLDSFGLIVTIPEPATVIFMMFGVILLTNYRLRRGC